jgi:hypothetical protein
MWSRHNQSFSRLISWSVIWWDDKPRSSVCTHSEHQARTINLLQSPCVSHKIVETYRNQHAPKNSKRKMEWCANGSTDQSHLRVWHLLRTGQNIGQAPWAFDNMDMCAIKVFNQSIKANLVLAGQCRTERQVASLPVVKGHVLSSRPSDRVRSVYYALRRVTGACATSKACSCPSCLEWVIDVEVLCV